MTCCTFWTVTSAKRILVYLKGTKYSGIGYNKENESNFREVYSKI